jgi:hypothetical protein
MSRALAVVADSITQPSPWSPTRRLAAAVLERALLDLAGRSPILRRDAAFWLTSARPVRIRFTDACAVLGLDPGAVRRRLLGDGR